MKSTTQVIVFFDIDGTLINSAHEPRMDSGKAYEIKAQISALKTEGILFGINSNRAIEDILPIYKLIGLNGPLIAENGILIQLSPGKTISFLESDQLRKISDTRRTLVIEMKSFFKEKYNHSAVWLNIDTVKFLGRKKTKIKDSTIIALNNKFRKYTLSIHIKKVIEGKFVNAIDIGTELVEYLKQKHSKPQDFDIILSKFGNIIAFSTMISKRKAAEMLIDRFYKGYTCYSIGDELKDYEMVKGFGKFIAVGNADKKVKLVADFSTKQNYSDGAMEALDIIAKVHIKE